MDSVEWKVCRLVDLHSSRLALKLGADYLGLHAVKGLDPERARLFSQISEEARSLAPRAKPVLLVKSSDTERVCSWVSLTGVQGVQLHVELDFESLDQLRVELVDRFGEGFLTLPVLSAQQEQVERSIAIARRIMECPENWPRVLVDSSWRGGTGCLAIPAALRRVLEVIPADRAIIAGGLSQDNVLDVISTFRPAGVDMQSSLEVSWEPRQKDPEKLIRMARLVKSAKPFAWRSVSYRPSVSVSVTDLAPSSHNSVISEISQTDVDSIHVDHSDGTLAPGFVRQCYDQIALLGTACPALPYDVHSFIENPFSAMEVIREYLNINPMLRTVFVQLERVSDDSLRRVAEHQTLISQLGVNVGIAAHAPGLAIEDVGRLLDFVRHARVQFLNIVAHSRTGGPDRISEYDLKLIQEIRDFESMGQVIVLGVDREIDAQRLAAVSHVGVDHAVSGQFVLRSSDMQARISDLRSFLGRSRFPYPPS